MSIKDGVSFVECQGVDLAHVCCFRVFCLFPLYTLLTEVLSTFGLVRGCGTGATLPF